ncbi:MAG: diguanylate cyclase [Pseudomonadota bacterium]
MSARAAWICPASDEPTAFAQDIRANLPVAWLRFEADSWAQEEPPHYFFSRIARFEAIAFIAMDADGTVRSARYLEAEGKPFAAGPVFELPLPEITADTEALLVRIERPHSVPLLTEARLSVESEHGEWSQFDVMLLPLVIGMLILPLLFDISFSIVLRERFVAIHAVMVASMIFYVLFAGGLISMIAAVPLNVIAVMGPLSYAIGCGLSAFFLADFLEKDAQSPLMRKIMLATGFWSILVPGFFALQLHSTQAFDDHGYFYSFMPAILIITCAILEALWRGSRAARFMALAWTPIILASIERMARGLGLYAGSSQLDQFLYLAVGIEVIVISLAIADRFLAIRRERDAAVTEARMLEQLSSHDPLTGLMNRRAVEARFAELRAQGFDTFALIDLDKFKDVNDRFGHQVGDSALIAAASALSSEGDRDTIAVRLGGEEFVLLLRGPDSTQRADHLRQAIPRRIANEIPALDRLVTASMGVLELPRIAISLMAFDELYARADTLLYEAKAAGRNRMLYERLSLFDPRGEETPAKTPKADVA